MDQDQDYQNRLKKEVADSLETLVHSTVNHHFGKNISRVPVIAERLDALEAATAILEQRIATLFGRPQQTSGPPEKASAFVTQELLDERQRQKFVEGHSEEHDDYHDAGELAAAAAYYACPAGHTSFPWHSSGRDPDIKTKDRRRQLVIAGALIVAEIERLDRLARRKR